MLFRWLLGYINIVGTERSDRLVKYVNTRLQPLCKPKLHANIYCLFSMI